MLTKIFNMDIREVNALFQLCFQISGEMGMSLVPLLKMKHVQIYDSMIFCFNQRHCTPRGKRKVCDQTMTRANGWGAYISFSFRIMTAHKVDVAIVRKHLVHTGNWHKGHDIFYPKQQKVNRLDDQLADYIQCLISLVSSHIYP